MIEGGSVDGGFGDTSFGTDGGTGEASSGDSSTTTDASSTCVQIDLSTYDLSCTQASDCFAIQTGTVCNGQCACGGTPVNIDGQAMYDNATSGITFAACPCATYQTACINSTCTFAHN